MMPHSHAARTRSRPACLSSRQWTRYRDLNKELWLGLQVANITGQSVLVIGSQSPWVEALCLGAGASQVYTLEYARLVTDHPRVTTLTPEVFLSQARGGALPRFGSIVTASSLEHSGLGRYNDGLSPWGDILAVARAWCVSARQASLVVAVPTARAASGKEARTEQEAERFGTDTLGFNAARTYGPVRYPLLTTNWRFIHRVGKYDTAWGQTVYVLRRQAAP